MGKFVSLVKLAEQLRWIGGWQFVPRIPAISIKRNRATAMNHTGGFSSSALPLHDLLVT